MNQCESVNTNGERCRARPLSGSTYCYFHAPDAATQRRESQQAGGRARRAKTLPATTEDFALETPRDIGRLLAETISQVRRGEIDPKIATTVGYLANLLLNGIQSVELQQRVEALERLYAGKRHHSLDFSDLESTTALEKGN